MRRHTTRVALSALFLFVASAAQLVPTAYVRAADVCASYRWDVQTLSDAGRGIVDDDPVLTTVDDLRSLERPGGIDSTSSRTVGTESTTFRLRTRLVSVRRDATGVVDLTVAMRGDVRNTMVVSFNPASCIERVSRRDEQTAARRALLDRCGRLPVDTEVPVKGIATIEGVGFWGDGTAPGSAPNGIELAPAVSFFGDCWRDSPTFVVALVGDSVPLRLADDIAERTGWRVVNAAVGGCPGSGEEPVDRRGEEWTTEGDCRRMVPSAQAAALKTHPDVVLWWERPSVSHFLSFSGKLVLASTERFWTLRRSILSSTARRLTRDGAAVAFVATEPLSDTAAMDRPWRTYFTSHYFDHVERWNAMMSEYATLNADLATYLDIRPAICNQLTSPCDDRTGGVPARPDGVHFDGPGIDVALDALLSALQPLVQRMGG